MYHYYFVLTIDYNIGRSGPESAGADPISVRVTRLVWFQSNFGRNGSVSVKFRSFQWNSGRNGQFHWNWAKWTKQQNFFAASGIRTQALYPTNQGYYHHTIYYICIEEILIYIYFVIVSHSAQYAQLRINFYRNGFYQF